MSKEDPYYTYTDFWPAKRTSRKVSWLLLFLVLAAVLALAGAMYFGAELLSSLSALGG